MLQKTKYEGELFPTFYGPAYRDFDREVTVCYPLGLHLLMRWMRDLWCWLMVVGRPGYRENLETKAYCLGYNTKEQQLKQSATYTRKANQDKYSKGWDAAFKQMDTVLSSRLKSYGKEN